MEPLEILKKYWGFDAFRPLQLEIIQEILQGRDTLALMPTGGGKSITFQVPALAREGICLVVSPLIALMKDQVEHLRGKGIKAVAVYSGMSGQEIDTALTNCIYGDYKFLYLSPERTDTTLFRQRVREMNVNLIAVDEAHCISQWGYDFRPSYLKLAELRTLLPGVPVLALTATATCEVTKDIQDKLLFAQPNILKKSFLRENLSYIVRTVEDKQKYLLQTFHKSPGTGIIYVRNRLKSREIAEFLNHNGIPAHCYHAGLSSEVRSQRQDEWMCGKVRIMVATNAFGMGIDKEDVRFVIHLDLPDSVEAYFQEAGRAGRDGKDAYAVLLYHPSDRLRLERQHRASYPPLNVVRKVYQHLGDYLQVPVGEGQFHSFTFEISQFIKTYHLELMQAYYSLKTLEREGYILYEEDVDQPSRVLFLVNRDELYRFRVSQASFDDLIKAMLRSYTGLFTDYTSIDVHALALKARISPLVASECLVQMDRIGILDYIPRRVKPLICFTQPRYDSHLIILSPENYALLRDRDENRMKAMFQYAETDNKCRSSMLLHYFGEERAVPCGRCDYCRKKDEQGMSRAEARQIRERLMQIAGEGPILMDTLIDKSQVSQEKALKVVRQLLDEGLFSVNEQREIVPGF